MEKVIIVKTDDPNKSRFNLKVTGPVEKIVEIEPSSVYMEGKPGAIMSSTVRITPSAKYPFALLKIKKLNNTPIQADLVKPDSGNPSWQLNIKAASDVKNEMYEVLEIQTDSKYKSEIVIRVTAVFHEPKK